MGWINHHGIEALAIYYVLSAIIGGMPTPPPNASLAYQWAFRSGAILSASLARLAATTPGLKDTAAVQKLTGTTPPSNG